VPEVSQRSPAPHGLLGLTTRLSFIDQALVSGGNFAAGILMARAFGLYEFGRFTLVWMAVEFLMSLHAVTVIQPMLYIGPKEAESDHDKYFGAVAAQQAIFCLITAGLAGVTALLAGMLFAEPVVSALAAPLFASVATYQLHNFFRRYLFVREQPVKALLVDVTRFGLQITATFALLFRDDPAEASAGLWIIAGACTLSTIVGACNFGKRVWDGRFFRDTMAHHWEFSKWLLPSAVMHWLTSQAYILVCGIVLGAAATGSLRAALGLTGVLNILVQALDSFAPAQASRAFHRGGRAELLEYIVRLAVLLGVLTTVTVIALNLAPGRTISLIYGKQYEEAGYLVRWLCAPTVFYIVAVILTIWAATMERTRLIFRSYLAATIFTVVAAYPLALLGGLPGIVGTWLGVEIVRAAVLLRDLQARTAESRVVVIPRREY
jgi:O-antigen/teichoic acid export membrane protein